MRTTAETKEKINKKKKENKSKRIIIRAIRIVSHIFGRKNNTMMMMMMMMMMMYDSLVNLRKFHIR